MQARRRCRAASAAAQGARPSQRNPSAALPGPKPGARAAAHRLVSATPYTSQLPVVLSRSCVRHGSARARLARRIGLAGVGPPARAPGPRSVPFLRPHGAEPPWSRPARQRRRRAAAGCAARRRFAGGFDALPNGASLAATRLQVEELRSLLLVLRGAARNGRTRRAARLGAQLRRRHGRREAQSRGHFLGRGKLSGRHVITCSLIHDPGTSGTRAITQQHVLRRQDAAPRRAPRPKPCASYLLRRRRAPTHPARGATPGACGACACAVGDASARLLLQILHAMWECCAPRSLALGRLAHSPISRWREIRSSHAMRRCSTLRRSISLHLVKSQRCCGNTWQGGATRARASRRRALQLQAALLSAKRQPQQPHSVGAHR